MLRFLRADELPRFPALAETMFRDRARQFRDRLGWAVRVDARGWEMDEYDRANPLYVIWQAPDGSHLGSMRFLPTLGPTMVNDHFARLAPGGRIADPDTWECTRFCLSERAEGRVSAALMLGAAELGLGLGLARAVAVFDARMVRIYRLLGWPPEILGSEGAGREAVSLGFWRFSPEIRLRMAGAAGIAPALSRLWLTRALGPDPLVARAG